MNTKGLLDATGISGKDQLAAYRMALSGISHTAVREAATRFIAGAVERNSHAFMPNAPEFAAEARRIDRILSADMARLRDEQRTLDGLTADRSREKSTPEQLERIRAMHAAFKLQHAESKRKEDAAADPFAMDEERERRMEQILSLPVRSSARPEEIRFASNIQKRIEGASA